MAESPPGGRAPEGGDKASDARPKSGESDPLFNPPGLAARRTVMGLAPAPHTGGANRGIMSEAEERKQRVLARIAAMESGRPPAESRTGPPPPNDAPVARPASVAPPAPAPSAAPVARPAPVPAIVEETYIGLPPNVPGPAFGTTTAIIPPQHASFGPGGETRRISSDGRLPAASGWDVHDPSPRPERVVLDAEVDEAAPNTARMAHTGGPASRGEVQRPAAASAALALREHDPSPSRHALSGPLDERLVLLAEPYSPRAASFRLLRDSLVARSMPRVLAVSSAAPKNGKTTCAINLALALAEQASTRVLLIDGNFFEPELGAIFAIDRLTPIVPPDGAAWLAPYRLVEITSGFHVAGVVRAPGEPPPRFEQQRFEAIIERLVRVSYDFIIIDTPALRGTPAVAQMIAAADATLLAVRAGATTAGELRRAAEQIPPTKALGVALIDGPPQI
ncbi:MAG: CpsD/CapB family tyrosine-protein kinase [Labilithrix sp.]|nr:CpsD/CapB family tyrosine-protein kinase [Labilithrix sp.]